MAKSDFLGSWRVVSKDPPELGDVDVNATFTISDGSENEVHFSFTLKPPHDPGFGSGYANPPTGTYDSTNDTVKVTFGNGQELVGSLSQASPKLNVAVQGTLTMLSGNWDFPEAGEWGADADPGTL